MCISATVSFSMAGLLIGCGGFCLHKARHIDHKYIPLALFPVFVGIQQLIEGYVWTGLNLNNQNITISAALGYLFFTWILWPIWVPYMVRQLEPTAMKRKLLLWFSIGGGLLGLVLYIPNFWYFDWLTVERIHHSIAYKCTLATDIIIHRWVLYVFYLTIIGVPPLLSSHKFMKIFGTGLVIAVPLTALFFSYANISVLCFFAAVMTLYIIYIIMEGKCGSASSYLLPR